MSGAFPGWAPVAAAAETVGRKPHTVWTWVKRGIVRHHRIDRAVYVNIHDVAQAAGTRPHRTRRNTNSDPA